MPTKAEKMNSRRTHFLRRRGGFECVGFGFGFGFGRSAGFGGRRGSHAPLWTRRLRTAWTGEWRGVTSCLVTWWRGARRRRGKPWIMTASEGRCGSRAMCGIECQNQKDNCMEDDLPRTKLSQVVAQVLRFPTPCTGDDLTVSPSRSDYSYSGFFL